MSALDATFLDVEDAVSHMHIGSVGIFEGPVPEDAELRRMVRGKLPLVPRYRQVVKPVPLGIGRPVWAEDAGFDLEYHLRRTGVPAPGGELELHRLVGRLMSLRLDRSRPLWEMWMVEGLDAGRWAIVSKIHHCMADGVAGSDLLTLMMDRDRAGEPAAPDRWTPRPPPADILLLAGGVVETVGLPLAALRALWRTAELRRRGAEVAQGLLRMREVALPTPASSLNGPLGTHRTWSVARARLSEIKEVRSALGGTVNDVVLSSIAGGFRRLLSARGESLNRPLRSLVPVSVRAVDEHGEYNNRVSAMFADLPVGVADPLARLQSVRAQMAELKGSHEAAAGEALTAAGDFAPPLLLSLAERLATRIPQRNINTVTTNVPGPQHPLYVCGRLMLESFPYVPLGGHVRVGIAIYSYNGACMFGVTGDYDAAPDIGVLCEGIESSLAELLALARDRTPAPAAAWTNGARHREPAR